MFSQGISEIGFRPPSPTSSTPQACGGSLKLKIADSLGMGIRGGQGVLFIPSWRGDFPLVLKKANHKNKKQTIGLFGDPRPSEQDEHSWDCICQSLHTETSGDLPNLAGFTKDPLGNGNILESVSKLRGSLPESFLNLLLWSSLCIPWSRRGGLTFWQEEDSCLQLLWGLLHPCSSFSELLTLRTVSLLSATSALTCLFSYGCPTSHRPGLHLFTFPPHQLSSVWSGPERAPSRHYQLSSNVTPSSCCFFLLLFFPSWNTHLSCQLSW